MSQDWRWQLDHLIRSADTLVRDYGCTLPEMGLTCDDPGPFPMWITPYYAGLIDKNDADDPILRQVLPLRAEFESRKKHAEFGMDPLAENEHSPVPGLIHRYPDRAVLLTTGFCATLCRFCLRKRAWSSRSPGPDFDLDAVVEYLSSHSKISDLILSGGDPLLLHDNELETILDRVTQLPNIKMIRIGTRTPVTLPMRIDDTLTALLARYKPFWMLTHFNHPREVTPEAVAALEKLAGAGAIMQNQSVLLKGVNDSTSVLVSLSRKLLEHGVRPYYLHQVDWVRGVDHFRVSMSRGMEIVKAMFGQVSGLGIPRYVLDIPGGKGKVPLMPDFVMERTEKNWKFHGPLDGTVDIPNG